MSDPKSRNLVAEALGEFAAGKTDDHTGLIAAMVQQNYNDYTANVQKLMDNYKSEADELRATLDIIRADIGSLFDLPYMPSPHIVMSCLCPEQTRIDELIRRRADSNGVGAAYPRFGKTYR
jgi:hypothetical protein